MVTRLKDLRTIHNLTLSAQDQNAWLSLRIPGDSVPREGTARDAERPHVPLNVLQPESRMVTPSNIFITNGTQISKWKSCVPGQEGRPYGMCV